MTPDHAELIQLLHELDGQLGLAVHRREGTRPEWKTEASQLITRIRSTIKELETDQPLPTDEHPFAYLQGIVNAQAEDPNLWRVVDTSLFEEYLQRALRALHEAIESVVQTDG